MSCCQSQTSGSQLVTLTTERLKVLRVIDEKFAQVVVESTVEIPAVKIDRIEVSVKDVTDHIFTGKIVKQGTFHKQIFFVDATGVVREMNEDVPFVLAVDIPGLDKKNPWLEIEDKVLKIETDFILQPKACHEPALLKQKVEADFLVKVSEWVQLDVVVKPGFFTKTNPMNTIIIRS